MEKRKSRRRSVQSLSSIPSPPFFFFQNSLLKVVAHAIPHLFFVPFVIGYLMKKYGIAKKLWDSIDALNQKFGKTLLDLSDLALRYPKEYPKVIKYLSTIQWCQVGISQFSSLFFRNKEGNAADGFFFFCVEILQWLANPSLSESEQCIIDSFYTARQTTQVQHLLLFSLYSFKISDISLSLPLPLSPLV